MVHSLWASVCVLYFAPCRYTSTRDIYFIVYFIYYPLLSTFFPFFLPQWNHISPSRRACREKGDNSSFIIIPFCKFPLLSPTVESNSPLSSVRNVPRCVQSGGRSFSRSLRQRRSMDETCRSLLMSSTNLCW